MFIINLLLFDGEVPWQLCLNQLNNISLIKSLRVMILYVLYKYYEGPFLRRLFEKLLYHATIQKKEKNQSLTFLIL